MVFNIATYLAWRACPAPGNGSFLTESSPLGLNGEGSGRSLDDSPFRERRPRARATFEELRLGQSDPPRGRGTW